MHREIFDISSDSDASAGEEEQKQHAQAAVVYRKKPNKSNLGSRIISNPKLIKSIAEEEELEGLNKRLSFNPNSNNAKRTSTYIYCEDDQNKTNPSAIKKRRRYLGIVLAIFTSIAFSLSSLIVKAIPEYHPYSVVVWTFQGILLPSIPVVLYHRCISKEKICNTVGFESCAKFKIAFFVLLRGLLGSGGIVLRCYSLQYMNMADSTVIAFSSPIFVVIIAWFFLGEKCGIVPIIAAFVTLVGVGLISRPPVITGDDELDKDQIIGASMSFGCMLLGTFAVVVLRYIREVHFALVTLVYGLVGTMGGLSLALATGNLEFPQGTLHWSYAVGIALLTFIGQSSLTLALKFEQAGPVSLIRTSEIIFAFLWEFLFFGVIPDWISLVGASIVMLGVILITVRSWLNALPENHGVLNKIWSQSGVLIHRTHSSDC